MGHKDRAWGKVVLRAGKGLGRQFLDSIRKVPGRTGAQPPGPGSKKDLCARKEPGFERSLVNGSGTRRLLPSEGHSKKTAGRGGGVPPRRSRERKRC